MWSGIVQRAAYELISTVAYQSPSSLGGGDDDNKKRPQQPEKSFFTLSRQPVLFHDTKGEVRSPWRTPASLHVTSRGVFSR